MNMHHALEALLVLAAFAPSILSCRAGGGVDPGLAAGLDLELAGGERMTISVCENN